MKFYDTKTCSSGAICTACRDREGGRALRQGIAHKLDVVTQPGDPFGDFVCILRGLKWDDPEAAQARHDRLARGLVQIKTSKPTDKAPGGMVRRILNRLEITPKGNCGCAAMEMKMNEWGWWGCWKHRGELVAWFSGKARAQSIEVTPQLVMRAIVATWRELRAASSNK